MSFLGTIFLLAAVVSGILIPILVGHGLAVQDYGYIGVGVGAGVVSAIFVFLYSRVAARSGGETH
ncbi:MAG TPA: hypothetical protein VF158_16625 [Longimicrobiales bacterium]